MRRARRVLTFASAASLLATAFLIVSGTGSVSVAGAASGVALTISPGSLSPAGGHLDVLVHGVIAPTSCSLTSSDPSLTLPSCTSLAVPEPVQIPADVGASAQHLTFTYKADDLGTRVTATARVTVSAASGSYYVALGDSFSSGEGNKYHGWVNQTGSVTSDINSTDGCDRSTQSYPELVRTWLKTDHSIGAVSFAFVACSGATTSDMDASSPAATVGLKGKTSNHGEPVQFGDTAELARARLVTISAGGNDINFPTVAATCVATPGLCGPGSPISSVRNLQTNIGHLAPVLDVVYSKLRNLAPGATIDVVEYPDFFPPVASLTTTELANGCDGFKGSTLRFLSGAQAALNLVVEQSASSAGFSVVNPNAGAASFLGSGGHTLCSTSSRWLNGLQASGSFRPNKYGQVAMAKAVEAANTTTSFPGHLSGVKRTVSDGNGYCALLTSGAVDCWGLGQYGELGNGQYNDSAVPVRVVSTSGTGRLTGVASLTGSGSGGYAYGYCALLTSGAVDCWGHGYDGELGNGQYYQSGNDGSAVPVGVVSTSGTGRLTGVASLTSDADGYCALLTSGAVDCWGYGYEGELGNGQYNDSAVPISVVSTSGTGRLTGVTSLTGSDSDSGSGYCALLTSGAVDCWGYGYDGELGNGQYYTSGNDGSGVPVRVVSS